MQKPARNIISNADNIENVTLDNQTLAAIGEIAMIGAELDDIFTSVIFSLSKINPADGYLIIGKSSISSKLAMLEYLYKKYLTTEDINQFKSVKKLFQQFIACRNALCHGVMLGIIKDTENIIFLIPTSLQNPEDGITTQKLQLYTEKQIISLSKGGRALLDFYQEPVNGRTSREIHIARLHKDPDPNKARRS